MRPIKNNYNSNLNSKTVEVFELNNNNNILAKLKNS